MLVTHANTKGLSLTPLFRDRRGFMPPQLKTKQSIQNLRNQLNNRDEMVENSHGVYCWYVSIITKL